MVGAWTAYGILGAWQSHYWYALSGNPMSWSDAFRYEVCYAWLWAAATPAIFALSRRFPFERGIWGRNLAVHALAMIVVVPAVKVAFDWLTMPPSSPFHDFSWTKLVRSMEATFDTGTLLYAVVVLVQHASGYYSRYQSGLVKASKLQTQLVQAQLHALKMQLHPHFLFNTLHTIGELVHEDPALAERTIARLGELLRLFLANSTVHEVALREELRVLDLYLEIERTRFEGRLTVTYDVPGNLLDETVPSLILQPLVENAIRHGLAKSAKPGQIRICAERSGGSLQLRVVDNGSGIAKEHVPGKVGMGLGITRGRLESLYGTRFSLTLRNLATGGAETVVIVPSDGNHQPDKGGFALGHAVSAST